MTAIRLRRHRERTELRSEWRRSAVLEAGRDHARRRVRRRQVEDHRRLIRAGLVPICLRDHAPAVDVDLAGYAVIAAWFENRHVLVLARGVLAEHVASLHEHVARVRETVCTPAIKERGAHRADDVDDRLAVVVAIDGRSNIEAARDEDLVAVDVALAHAARDGRSPRPRRAGAPEDVQLVSRHLDVVRPGTRHHGVARKAPADRVMNTIRVATREALERRPTTIGIQARYQCAPGRLRVVAAGRLRCEQRVAVPEKIAADPVRIALRGCERMRDLRPGVVSALEDLRRIGADSGHAVAHGHRPEVHLLARGVGRRDAVYQRPIERPCPVDAVVQQRVVRLLRARGRCRR